MKERDKQYVVLGLGVFGSTVAKTLSNHGCEVLAIDSRLQCVERIADDVTKAAVADATSKDELLALGIEEFDVAIIAMGNHLEEAVLTTMALKDMGVPYVIANAKNKQYKQILEKVGADKVVRVEKEMGVRIAKSLLRKSIVDLIELDESYCVVEIKAPAAWIGKTLQLLDVRNRYNMNVLGVKERDAEKLSLNLGADYVVRDGDHFLVVAETRKIEKLDYLTKS